MLSVVLDISCCFELHSQLFLTFHRPQLYHSAGLPAVKNFNIITVNKEMGLLLSNVVLETINEEANFSTSLEAFSVEFFCGKLSEFPSRSFQKSNPKLITKAQSPKILLE